MAGSAPRRSASEGRGAVRAVRRKRATSTLRRSGREPRTAGDKLGRRQIERDITEREPNSLSSAIAIRLAVIWNGTNPSIPRPPQSRGRLPHRQARREHLLPDRVCSTRTPGRAANSTAAIPTRRSHRRSMRNARCIRKPARD